ncbi:AAA family ATPase [Cupriavidus basilensis]
MASADGDGRKLLNNIEIVARAARSAGVAIIDKALLGSALSRHLRRFDKGARRLLRPDQRAAQIGAWLRPDATLYWFCRMLDGGADPRYLARRMCAWHGKTSAWRIRVPPAITLDAAETYASGWTRPKAKLALAQALIYLAVAPKSNAGYDADSAARAFVAKDKSRGVPVHLRNAPTKLMKELGHGHAYRYAHDEPGGLCCR